MELNDPYRPRPASVSLVFAARRGGNITDLRHGIFRFWTRFYPYEVGLRMCTSLTYNYHFSQNRRERCIIVTAEACFAEHVLLDLFARLSQRGEQLRTPLTAYDVTIEGNVDVQRLQALSWHYFWTNRFFERRLGRHGERYLLN